MTTEQAARPRRTGAARARARAPQEVARQAPPVEETQALTGEMVDARISRIEWAFYGAFTIIGAIMRFWDLGSRALHHDESLHATYSWYLWQAITWNVWKAITGTNPGSGYEYHYDPMMHGPYQFHLNALMYLIFGVGNASARLNAAICGTALIILPILLRRQLGRVSALILSGLLAFSPAFLYYSRFSREDIYFALWTAVFFVGLIRWLDARGRPGGHRWLYMAAAGFALSWATFEATYFTIIIALGFVVGVFAVAYAYQFLAPDRQRGTRGGAPQSLLVATLGDFSRANLPPLLAAFRGTPARAWWSSLGIIAAITLVLFWPIGDPWQWGFIPGAHMVQTTNAQNQPVYYSTDFLTGGLSYWKLQQGVQRGAQPWYYYFLVIPLYEQVAVVFGAAGLVYYFFRRRSRLSLLSGAAFALFTGLTLFVGPNLSRLPHYGLVLLMIASGTALLVSQPRSLLINLLLWWTVMTWALYIYAGEKMPWLTLHILVPTCVVAALYLGQLFRAPRWSARWLVTAALLALTGLLSFRSAVALAYVDGANPTEMLVYTQTAPDVPNVSAVIHRIPLLPTTTGARARVWVDGASTWPWVWYLRDDPSNHGWQDGDVVLTEAAAQRYPVIIVGDQDPLHTDGKQAQLAATYTGYKFKLRWWFPEDYKDWVTSGLGGFLQQAVQPATWVHLWRWWATRTPFDQAAFASWSNVTSFYVYVRNDLVKQYVPRSWAAAHQRAEAAGGYTPPALLNDVPAALTRPVVPILTVSGATLPRPMAVIRAVAVDRAGDIYLTDAAAQHVVKLDRAGRYLTAWGSPGAGPGQFSSQNADPMGIAVAPDGHVYVSDTWNHRVEEFTANGAFVRAFGHPDASLNAPMDDAFYGPRQLAVAPNGDVYVADTGNERIQVYSPQGVHLSNIGSGSHQPETALGRFDEPSGIAIDRHGIVYVADYWDKRIQRFSLSGTALAPAFPIAGWTTGDYGEPYLAVDNAGHLFATDAPNASAHAPHVLELDAGTGRLIRAFGATGTSSGALIQPSGIAVGPDGALYIADAGAVKLIEVQP